MWLSIVVKTLYCLQLHGKMVVFGLAKMTNLCFIYLAIIWTAEAVIVAYRFYEEKNKKIDCKTSKWLKRWTDSWSPHATTAFTLAFAVTIAYFTFDFNPRKYWKDAIGIAIDLAFHVAQVTIQLMQKNETDFF